MTPTWDEMAREYGDKMSRAYGPDGSLRVLAADFAEAYREGVRAGMEAAAGIADDNRMTYTSACIKAAMPSSVPATQNGQNLQGT